MLHGIFCRSDFPIAQKISQQTRSQKHFTASAFQRRTRSLEKLLEGAKECFAGMSKWAQDSKHKRLNPRSSGSAGMLARCRIIHVTLLSTKACTRGRDRGLDFRAGQPARINKARWRWVGWKRRAAAGNKRPWCLPRLLRTRRALGAACQAQGEWAGGPGLPGSLHTELYEGFTAIAFWPLSNAFWVVEMLIVPATNLE